MPINEISIPFVVDTFTFDLPVSYIRDNIKNPLFLTKTGILRNNTALVRCSQEPSVFSVGKKVVKVMNKTAKINEKKSIDMLKLINYKNKFSNDSHWTSIFIILQRIRFLLQSETWSNIFLWQCCIFVKK
jgi:hypothetical protein